jgi:hypothetical protein
MSMGKLLCRWESCVDGKVVWMGKLCGWESCCVEGKVKMARDAILSGVEAVIFGSPDPDTGTLSGMFVCLAPSLVGK